MNEHISEATEITLNLYDSIDSYKFTPEVQVKYKALGQCLRSIMEILQDERRKRTTA